MTTETRPPMVPSQEQTPPQPTTAEVIASRYAASAGGGVDSTESPVQQPPMPEATATHLPIKALNIMDLVVDPNRPEGDPMRFHIQFIDTSKNVQELPITPRLLKLLDEDGVTMMSKSEFILFKNRQQGAIDRIRHMPKDIYKGWETEDEEQDSLPSREEYSEPH